MVCMMIGESIGHYAEAEDVQLHRLQGLQDRLQEIC